MEDERFEHYIDNPVDLARGVYQQVLSDVRADLTYAEREKTHQEGINKTYDSYSEKHPDFDSMWESGELQRFMNENPGHNPISAHAEIKASKEPEVVTEPPASASTVPSKPADQRLSDTKRHGGISAVLAQRLVESRSQ